MIYKWIISILVVVTLSEVSKKMNPVLGGILSGLPLGTGLSVYFISYEKGIEYLNAGIPWAVASLSASILFCLVYLLAARRMSNRSNLMSLLVSSLCGILIFISIGYVLTYMELTLLYAILLFVIVFIVNIRFMRKLLNQPKPKSDSKSRLTNVLIRGVIVGAIILVITGLGVMLGSKWSGILSSFPSTLFPLIVILHYEEGNKFFPFVIKGFSYSVSTLAVFYISFLILSPVMGLNLGFMVTYVLCGIYLLVFFNYKVLIHRFRRERRE